MDRQKVIASIFGVPKALVGMIHLPALPGSPRSRLTVDEIRRHAVAEAVALADAGFHGLMIENMHDRPYSRRSVGPEVVAAMAVIGREIRRTVSLPLGVQILAGANREAVAAASACGASFVRAEGYVFAHLADEGFMESDAGDLLRYRRAIGAEQIRLFVDVKKKHASHAISSDVDLVDTARAAEFFLADGIVITGSATGRAADPRQVESVSRMLEIPTLVGSGITARNLREYPTADAWIVGSALKSDGLWSQPLDPERIEGVIRAYQALASASTAL